MKKLILSLFVILNCAFGAPTSAVVSTDTLTVDVPAGKMLKILNLGTTSSYMPIPYFYVYTNPGTGQESEFAGNYYGPQSSVFGPVKFRVRPIDSIGAAASIYVMYEIVDYSSSFTPLGAATIPSDAIGQFSVVMEQSTDLNTWNPALPGNYSAGSSGMFFRVRIVKN
jgi:hypothetical protein